MPISRRHLLLGGAAGLAGAALLPGLGRAAAPKPTTKPKIWLWLRLNRKRTESQWKRRFAQLAAAGTDAVLLQVFPSKHALWDSQVLPVKDRLLETLAPLAKSAGLEVHAWMHTLRCNVKPVMDAHPEWYSVSRQGKSSLTHPPYTEHYKWLCPTRPAVRTFLGRVAGELAAFDGVDGVHLDFIRHPDVRLPPRLQRKRGIVQDHEMPEFDFCYCTVCRETFQGRTDLDPFTLADADQNLAWRRFRCESVTGVVQDIRQQTTGKQLTAAVFPTPQMARGMVRQEWDKWPLDGVMPMLYQRGYDQPISWLKPACAEGVAAVGGRFPLFAGLLASTIDTDDIATAVEHARAGGAAGVALFNAKDAHLKALAAAAARQ